MSEHPLNSLGAVTLLVPLHCMWVAVVEMDLLGKLVDKPRESWG